jgi:hypothetical protein
MFADMVTKGRVARAVEDLDDDTRKAISSSAVPAAYTKLDELHQRVESIRVGNRRMSCSMEAFIMTTGVTRRPSVPDHTLAVDAFTPSGLLSWAP